MRAPRLIAVVSLLCLGLGTGVHAAALPFKSTSSPEAWKVTFNVSDIDNDVNQFLTTGFVDAKIISGRAPEGVNWIANNTSGTNDPFFKWTQFVFRQEFDLTGFDPSTASLSFQWAADDSGAGSSAHGSAGSWKPKYRVNGGSLINGSWPTSNTYSLGLVTDVTSGFIDGVNTIDFYVQGNGVTDGFALKSLGLNADPRNPTTSVPGPLPALGLISGFLSSRKLRKRLQGSR